MRDVLVRMLSDEGYQVADAASGEKAVVLAESFLPDVVVMDQNLPGISGQEATERIVEQVSGVKVIVITAFGAIERVVEAMRRGAYDYLTKPFDNDELLLRIARATEARDLARKLQTFKEVLGEQYSFARILGESEAMQAAVKAARRAAVSDVPVLVEGESGTGKELLVRAIHGSSARLGSPFVAVNCAAIARDLVESEFFGHEKGAFTGADEQRVGRFEQANGGTLFLDEISEMPTGLQAKLLRALEESEITRVGGRSPIGVDVRVIAATNRSVAEAVETGDLREDLYHRLAVFTVRMPPLRERRDDIPALSHHFLSTFAQENPDVPGGLSEEALGCLVAHDWPGNVRELRNAVQSAAIMAEGDVIRHCDLPPRVRDVSDVTDGKRPIDDDSESSLAGALSTVERRMIAEALEEEGGNRSRAAIRLGINRKTLISKIAQYGL